MQLNATSQSFADQLPTLGWVESYTIAEDNVPIFSWSGTDALRLHYISADGKLEPLCPFDPFNQTMPIAYGHRVAFFAEDTAENDLRLCIYDLHKKQLIYSQITASPRSKSVAWLDQDHLVTVECSTNGASLVLVKADKGDIVKKLLELPGGKRWVDPSPSVGPNGQLTLILCTEQGQHLISFDPQSGTSHILLRGNKSAVPLSACWSPSGRYIVCLVRRVQKVEAVLLNLVDRTMQPLNVPTLNDLPTWHPDDQHLVLTFDSWPSKKMAMYDIVSQSLSWFSSCEDLNAAFPLWHDHHCYFIVSAPDCPPALWCWEETSNQVYSVTPSFSVPSLALPEVLSIPSPLGFNIPCLLFKPKNGSSIRGTVLMLHGGPADCWRITWEPLVLSLTVTGYQVVKVNTRGSKFLAWPLPPVSPGSFGCAEVDDIGICLEYLLQQGLAQPGKFVIFGHSYGAFVAYRATLRFSKLLKAAVLTSGYLHPADLTHSHDPEVHRFLAYAFDSAECGVEGAASIETACPILIVHGEYDSQVPVAIALANMKRLRGEGHELLILPGEEHAYRKKENIACWIKKALAFLSMHIDKESTS